MKAPLYPGPEPIQGAVYAFKVVTAQGWRWMLATPFRVFRGSYGEALGSVLDCWEQFYGRYNTFVEMGRQYSTQEAANLLRWLASHGAGSVPAMTFAMVKARGGTK